MNRQLQATIESRLLPFVQKPMRYAGGELNCARKNLAEISIHGVLCFPDLYDIGMSHTGLQILYHIINSERKWALSRCFHPWADAEKLMRENGIPLYTLEYFTPVCDADWIGFSVQYELHFTNIVNMIDLAGLAPLRGERKETDPLVIAGGPCVSNPEPLAPFIDVFAIGDGEKTIRSVMAILEKTKTEGISRPAVLQRLSEVDGIYIPAFREVRREGHFLVPLGSEEPVKAAKVPDLSDEEYPKGPIVPLIEVVHRRLAVEVMRGCTRGCRFCSAGMYYRPVRERRHQSVAKQVREGVEATGWSEIGLLSLSTADYSSLPSLLEALREFGGRRHISCSLPSTRIDALSAAQLDLLEKVSSASSFTIAPEAGSERLRRVINKDFTDSMIYEAVHELMRRNVQTLKLYFMLGLPTENSADVEAIVTMTGRISGIVRAVSGRRAVHVSLSPFSPKPHTPFQRESMERPEALVEKSRFIKNSLLHYKNVKVSYRDPGVTLLETLLARGDRAIGELVYRAWSRGARFDGWEECFDLGRWLDCASDLSIDTEPYTGAVPPHQTLPWSAVSMGVSESFLEEERKRAYGSLYTPDCRSGRCAGCGVCAPGIGPVYRRPGDCDSNSGTEGPGPSVSGFPVQGTAYRFFYRKTGTIRFLGHLDMVGVIHRACLIAGLPLVYSQGFNPHPRIAFGPPLPFGVEGVREAFDAVLKGSPGENPGSLNRWLPEGIEITGWRKLPDGAESLNSSVTMARYRFVPNLPIESRNLLERIERTLASEQLQVATERKRRKSERNIRPGIIEVAVSGSGPQECDALLSMKSPTTCKPSEFAVALFPEIPLPEIRITRLCCHDGLGEIV